MQSLSRQFGLLGFLGIGSEFFTGVIMKSLNMSVIATLTAAACKAGDDLLDACTALQAEFKGCEAELVRNTLRPIVVAYYNEKKSYEVTIEKQGTGRIVLTGDASQVSAVTKRLNKIVAVVTATVADKIEIEVPADILAAAAKLWALCAQYESAGKLCASALATAKAK
jgi:hypothetical protein